MLFLLNILGRPTFPPYLSSFCLSLVINACQQLTVGEFPLSQVNLSCTTDRPDRFRELLKCDFAFGASCDSMVFDRKLLDLPLLTANPSMVSYLELLVGGTPQIDSSQSIVDDVRSAITICLAQKRFSIDCVAQQLGVGSRSLQRKLNEAGTSYRELLNQTRFILAKKFT